MNVDKLMSKSYRQEAVLHDSRASTHLSVEPSCLQCAGLSFLCSRRAPARLRSRWVVAAERTPENCRSRTGRIGVIFESSIQAFVSQLSRLSKTRLLPAIGTRLLPSMVAEVAMLVAALVPTIQPGVGGA